MTHRAYNLVLETNLNFTFQIRLCRAYVVNLDKDMLCLNRSKTYYLPVTKFEVLLSGSSSMNVIQILNSLMH